MAKNLVTGLILVPLTQIWAHIFFEGSASTNSFTLSQPIIQCNLQGNQRTKLEKIKNLFLDLILTCLVKFGSTKTFWRVLPLLVVIQCTKLSSYAISWKINEKNLRKWQKTNFGPGFGLFWPKVGPPPNFVSL